MPVPAHNKSSAKTPLQVMLIAPFIALVVLAVGITTYISFQNEQQAINHVAQHLRNEQTERIEEHLNALLNTPHQINQLNAKLIEQRMIDVHDQARLEHYFWEQIQNFKSVTSIYFGNPDGGVVNAGREGTQPEALYIITTDGFASGTLRKYAINDQGQRTTLLATVPHFDARQRPWYTSAVKKGTATWSDIYILSTGQDMAIAASRPVYDNQHNLLGVVSVDLFLSHLSTFLQSMKIGETGQSCILDRSGLLVASSLDEKLFTPSTQNTPPRRLSAYESTNPQIRTAAQTLTEQFGDYHQITRTQQIEFSLAGQRQFLQVSPVSSNYGPDWLIVVIFPEADFMTHINNNNQTTTFLIVLIVATTILVSIITARRITGPIMHLNASAQALAKGTWTTPIQDISQISETSELIWSFNMMAEQLQHMMEGLIAEIAERTQAEESLQKSNQRLQEALTELQQTQERMVQQERLAAVGQLAAGIAHDFNNILTSILGFAELLEISPETPESMRADLLKIIASGKRGAHLIRQILDFSRKSIRQPKQLDLVPLIKESMTFLEHTFPATIHLSIEIDPGDYLISADPTQIQQMLTNLALNAKDAMPDGGKLRVVLSHVEAQDGTPCIGCDLPFEGTWISIRIVDTGSGISPEVLPHIFEPFFTTKATGLGSGLGLAQVLGIIQQHNGHLTLDTQVGQGTTFTCYLPPSTLQQASEQRYVALPIQPGQGETILLVEDDPTVLETSQAMLQHLGYQVLAAMNGQEALALHMEHQATIALVVSDMVMPDMEGMALFKALKARDREIKVVMMSGYPLGEKGAELLEQGVVDWFQKPLALHDLAQVIDKALATQPR